MKYENIEEVANIIKIISEYQKTINDLELLSPYIYITRSTGQNIMSISLSDKNSEYSKEGEELINKIKTDLNDKIKNFKKLLAKI